MLIVDVYFEFASPEAAQAALSQIVKLRQEYSTFCTLVAWRENHNPCVVELDLFRHTADVSAIADALSACRATHNNAEIWPKAS